MEIYLDAFQRASWEENAGTALTPSDKIVGLAIGVTTPQDAPNAGEIWVDDLQLSSAGSVEGHERPEVVPTTAPDDTQPDESGEEQPEGRPALPCAGGIVLPFLFLGLIRLKGRKR